MRIAKQSSVGEALWWRAAVSLLALCAFSCSTSGTVGPASFESKDAAGFTLKQEVGVTAQVRSDFKRALKLIKVQMV